MITNTGREKLQQLIKNGGTGGGLPSYTAEDKDKVLTLVETRDSSTTERFTLIDEQTVHFNAYGEGDLAANSFRLPEGVDVVGKSATLVITIEGDTKTLDGEFFEYNGKIKLGVSEDTIVYEMTFTGNNAGDSTCLPNADATISAYMDVESKAVEPKWVGGGSGALVVNEDFMAGVLDKTWKEIADAITSGAVLATKINGGVTIAPIYASAVALSGEQKYTIIAYDYETGNDRTFKAATENDYPIFVD